MISVILPVYNGEQFLAKSIESCQKQTYTNWELLIIDDGSTDHSPEIAQKFAEEDHRIHYYRNEKNLRLPRTLNRGFSLASGAYLTWTSDDNYYYDTAFEKMVTALNEKKSDFVFSSCAIINEKDEQTLIISAPEDYAHAIWDYNFVGACFMYTRKVYEIVGDYDPDLFLCEDYDYWLRIFASFPVTYLDEILYAYRRHEKALSVTHRDGQYEAMEKALLKNFKLKKNPTTLDRFYLYRGLHRSRSLKKSVLQKYHYFPMLIYYKIWHKTIGR
ncbi:MAG: glycosyltransferase [Fusicatenibacter sp.]|nr:glycosyltransferase [Lachnospiraceae bacterium]MDY2936707.1 glycosyltransferase [Fusicatenibacter sp.]